MLTATAGILQHLKLLSAEILCYLVTAPALLSADSYRRYLMTATTAVR